MTPDTLITLADAAQLIPGADADTLKRRARQGKLVTYRPGKAYLTTPADVARMIEACRVERKVPTYGSGPLAPDVVPHGSSLTPGTSSVALDAMRATARELKENSRATSKKNTRQA